MAKRMICLIGIMMVVASCVVIVPAKAQDDSADVPFPVEMKVGEIFKVCSSGEVICPVMEPICDDLNIIRVVDTPEGLGFQGLAPGSTLCSVSSGGTRRVFRLTVR
jgi:hypothetical protein